jgi:hypothetical protein
MVEGSYAPNKRECAANAHNLNKKVNNILKGMHPNSIEQLAIAEIQIEASVNLQDANFAK